MSVEGYNIDAAMGELESNDEDFFLDPQTGEVLANTGDFGDYLGCKVDAVAPRSPPSHFKRIPDPALGESSKLAGEAPFHFWCQRTFVRMLTHHSSQYASTDSLSRETKTG